MTVWRWHFNSHEDLQRGLEEYGSMQDGTKVTHYGERVGGGEGQSNLHECLMRQNSEIDLRMAVLCDKAPTLFKLLDAYYRRAMCYEAKGWAVAARYAGLPHEPKNRYNRLAFEEVCTLAITELFHTRVVPKSENSVDNQGNPVV